MQRPRCREDFEIAIICALPLEYDAIALLFDEFWDKHGDPFGRADGDFNQYTTGRICKHDVVLALLSHVGKANAAAAAANMRTSYRSLRIVILAGICGGVPCNGGVEMFLGDVVVSSSVIQYDFGRHYPNGFMRKSTDEDNLRKYDKNIRNLLTKFGTSNGQDRFQERTAHFLKQLQENALGHRETHRYMYPGTDKDKLFESDYRHKHYNPATCVCSNCHARGDPVCNEALTSSCDELGCDEKYLVRRSRTTIEEQDKAQGPAIIIGAVASGDTVMKSGEDRDRIAKTEGIIAFEMEAAGVWEEMPCIVVKGICDYADCHKNKLWQHFAAATAASASKAILEQYIQTDRSRGPLIGEPPRGHFLVPFGRNQNFVGRQAILSRLLERVRPNGNKEDCQRTVIEGLGGVGKTQIALEVVYLLHNEHPGCSIFWVPTIDTTSFETAYHNIGKQLDIKGLNQDKADVKLLVKAALSEESIGYWLLVVDNADDVTLLFGDTGLSAHLPFSRNGSILFTTRNREASVRLDVLVDNTFSVTEMDQNEALALLQKGLKETQTSNMEATQKLLDILANLPLAIKQASAFMATKHVSTAEYLELCQSNSEDMISLLSKDFEDRYRYKEIQNPVATTWLVSFNQILHNDPLAAKYLQFISILAEKDIPKFLLPTSTKLKTVDAIGTLKGYAFITQQEGQDLFDMHRLVRLAMRNWLEMEGELKESVASAILRLNEVMPSPKHENRSIWIRCLPHAQAILELSEYLTGSQAEAMLFSKVAGSNSLLGKYQRAETMYRQALERDTMVLGKYHPDTLRDMNDLAVELRNLGKYMEAEQMHRVTLEFYKETFGENHSLTLISMSNLARVLGNVGRYEEAERMQRQALALNENILGKDNSSVLDVTDDLAFTLRELGRYQEAERMHRQVLEKRKKMFGRVHLNTLMSMKNLALVLGKLGRYKEAEEMHQQVLEQRKKILGKGHPETLISMDNVAIALGNLGKYKEAEEMHWKAFRSMETVLGKNHPLTLVSMGNLAVTLGNIGKNEDAEKMYQQATRLLEKVFGIDHPETRICRENFATYLRSKGRQARISKG